MTEPLPNLPEPSTPPAPPHPHVHPEQERTPHPGDWAFFRENLQWAPLRVIIVSADKRMIKVLIAGTVLSSWRFADAYRYKKPGPVSDSIEIDRHASPLEADIARAVDDEKRRQLNSHGQDSRDRKLAPVAEADSAVSHAAGLTDTEHGKHGVEATNGSQG